MTVAVVLVATVLVATAAVAAIAAALFAAASRGSAARGFSRSSAASGFSSAAGLLATARRTAAAAVVPVESFRFRGTDQGEQAGDDQRRQNITESHERAPSGQHKGFLLANKRFAQA